MSALVSAPTVEPAAKGAARGIAGPPESIEFVLPAELEASAPPEMRGITRDAVRMMVAYRSDRRLLHTTFGELPRFLDPGDLIVVNTSGTMPAAIDAVGAAGRPFVLHLSTRLPADLWTVEVRAQVGNTTEPFAGAEAGWVLELPERGRVTLLAPASPPGRRLWIASLELPEPLPTYLTLHGRPIKYSHVHGNWPLTSYQNVYASEPGSAEMPSAGRPFTPELITRLVSRGVGVTPLLLHTGVSSLEAGEAPYPEHFRVPAVTADRVNDAHRHGRSVIAIGTTVVRALESVSDEDGRAHSGEGWTETVITPERGVRLVDGLLTGWHEPGASHLAMLEAVGGRPLIEASYEAALEGKYLWHEFGDVNLILP